MPLHWRIVGGTALTSLTTDAPGTTSIGANISTTGAQTYNDAATLGTTSILTSTGSGNIGFGSTLNGAFGLTVDTAGTTSFGGIVGGTAALTSLTVAPGTTSIGANISTTGAQTYNDAVTLGATNITLNSNNNITINNGVSGSGDNLTLQGGASGNNIFTLVNGITLANLTVNGSATGTNTLNLQSSSPTQNWGISAANGGAVTGISTITGAFNFTKIANLIGSNNTDNFTLNGGTLSGSINGGLGTNTLATSNNVTNTWTITGSNAGSVTGVTGGFTNIQNLMGGTGTNNFVFNNGESISGNLVGGGSGTNNTLNLSNYIPSVSVNVSTGAATGIGGTFSNIDNLTGNDTSSTAISTISGLGNTTISGINIGSSGVHIFSGFGNLSGGNNTFTFNNGGSITGN